VKLYNSLNNIFYTEDYNFFGLKRQLVIDTNLQLSIAVYKMYVKPEFMLQTSNLLPEYNINKMDVEINKIIIQILEKKFIIMLLYI
jgi:hypothetical protein